MSAWSFDKEVASIERKYAEMTETTKLAALIKSTTLTTPVDVGEQVEEEDEDVVELMSSSSLSSSSVLRAESKRVSVHGSDDIDDLEDVDRSDYSDHGALRSTRSTRTTSHASNTNTSDKASDKFYRVYLIRLDHPTKSTTYVGSTNDMVRRLRQHNGEITGGAKSTSRRSCRGKYKWTIICTVGGPNMTHREALQFEKKVKVVPLSAAKGTIAERAQGKDRSDRKLHQRVRKMLIVSSLERWSKKSDRVAKDVPVTFTWYDPSFRPVESARPYLPYYVDEVVAES